MAETLNYRMNLVLEPKNVIKANRELRAMERYFERIQGRVLRIGRTRMAPEIVLKDRASAGLDRILGKIHRVKTQMIDASGNISMKVKVETGSLKSGGGAQQTEKPKSFWDKAKDFFSATKQIGDGVKDVTDLPGKFKAVGDAWKGKKPDDKKGEADKPAAPKKDEPITKTRKQRIKEGRFSRGKRLWKTANAMGDLVKTFGSSGENLIGGFQGFGELGKELFKGGSGMASKAASFVSTAVEGVGKSGFGSLAGRLFKSGAKRVFAPLGIGADIASIVSAKPGKERADAAGSAAGGGVGSAIGGILGSALLPGIGTFAGAAIGGMAGDFVGGKVGGWISDVAPKVKDSVKSVNKWFSKTFSFGKGKSKKDISQKPYEMTGMPTYSGSYGTFGAAYNSPRGSFGSSPALPVTTRAAVMAGLTGPRFQSATAPTTSTGKTIPQLVQISPEQMTALSGQMRDFKTETATNYNLPPGAVQVTVHEEQRVDVEGLIQQIGQRLRAEFQRAAQNQKPVTRAYQ
ncbi:hypothetical protein [Paenibacillus chibensis]|uniref:hypothetical protein n=1 Tax=Paenibacillus chibensis TaxID=59846 RepID=UPI000FD99DD8|nr:hypothetical protein [Paenibacillus chibensis]MEC0369422.1 hypothetical protein [Paenibacillus chibensis]